MEKEINEYIKKWCKRCYSELPDEAPKEIDEMVPSYKRIALAILKNDISILGINPPHSEWYDYYKKIELAEREAVEKGIRF